MAELILAPAVQRVMVNAVAVRLPIAGALAGISASMPVSSTLNRNVTESVLIWVNGGVWLDLVRFSPLVVAEFRTGKSMDRAEDVSRLISGVIRSLEGEVLDGHAVYAVEEVSGPVNLPEEQSPIRFTMSYTVDLRALAV